jgi:RNA-directed DNA polymerase
LNLIRSTRVAHSGVIDGDRQDPTLNNRWIRISLINVASLKEAFKAIDGSKAVGVDGISKKAYGEDLERSLEDLTERIQKGSYRPNSKREVLIPKSNGKTRPIAIACFEDKLVDWVVGKILTQIYELHFVLNSFGYRPGKSCDEAIRTCYYSLFKNLRPNVLEIDFSNFFNTIPHKKLMKILGQRIRDQRFKGLLGRFLTGSLINQQGESLQAKLGPPQGSIMSPLLANIYLDEVIDQWFRKEWGSYDNVMVRYADDGVFFFKGKEDAEKFMVALKSRAESFKLKLNAEKTRVITMNKKGHEQFNFLGFTFYWGKQGSRIILKVKTQKERLIRGIQEFYQWIKKIRNREKLSVIWSLAKSKILGHVNYYGY